MKRMLPTLLILLVMVLVGAMYWVDMAYYTDPGTGFLLAGPLWARYAMAVVPLVMGLLGLRTVGPKSISALRVTSKPLGALFCAAAILGIAWGGTLLLYAFSPLSVYRIVLGAAALGYGAWMFLAALQMFTQNTPSPTRSAVWGVLATLPFCMVTVYRIMARPSSLYRVGPLVRNFAALLAFLWLGMLLRSFYIALPRRRVRGLYMLGVATFLFATCLELPLTVYEALFSGAGVTAFEVVETLNLAVLGLLAGCVSVALAGKGDAKPAPQESDNDRDEKDATNDAVSQNEEILV